LGSGVFVANRSLGKISISLTSDKSIASGLLLRIWIFKRETPFGLISSASKDLLIVKNGSIRCELADTVNSLVAPCLLFNLPLSMFSVAEPTVLGTVTSKATSQLSFVVNFAFLITKEVAPDGAVISASQVSERLGVLAIV
jgi:hypothetical protein